MSLEALLGAGWLTAAASGPPPAGGEAAEKPPKYAAIVEQYHGGDSDGAIRLLLTLPPPEVMRMLRDPDPLRIEGPRIEPGRLPAAIMLHTEAGLRRNWEGRADDARHHWLVARSLARSPASRGHPAFLRAWYHALGLYFLESLVDAEAATLLEEGTARFPKDLSITFALGRVYEASGPDSAPERRGADFSPGPRHDLRRAEELYRSVLAADAECGEASLRLGRVLQLSGRSDAGFLELDDVARSARDPRVRYVARVFMGDQFLNRGEEGSAREEFEGALLAWPGGQAAAISLAQILNAHGLRQEAARVLQDALVASEGRDPYRAYYYGDPAEERQRLENVKAMAQDRT